MSDIPIKSRKEESQSSPGKEEKKPKYASLTEEYYEGMDDAFLRV